MISEKKEQRGRIFRHGNIWRIKNALVEEVFASTSGNGHIIVSYAEKGEKGDTYIEKLRLNIDKSTIISNQKGYIVPLATLAPGMWIDTDFSPNMTKSIPPQTTAFCIHITKEDKPTHVRPTPPKVKPTPKPNPQDKTPPPHQRPPARNSKITTGSVIDVDVNRNIITTGKKDNINEQMKFVVTHRTEILNKNGQPIPLSKITPGQFVKVEHANFQTLSIPPQSTAYKIQILR